MKKPNDHAQTQLDSIHAESPYWGSDDPEFTDPPSRDEIATSEYWGAEKEIVEIPPWVQWADVIISITAGLLTIGLVVATFAGCL